MIMFHVNLQGCINLFDKNNAKHSTKGGLLHCDKMSVSSVGAGCGTTEG